MSEYATTLVDHKTGAQKASWSDVNIKRCDDSDPLGDYLITVPSEDDYFIADPYDIVIFSYYEPHWARTEGYDVLKQWLGKWFGYCGIVTFKDYCDKDNLIIKVKAFVSFSY